MSANERPAVSVLIPTYNRVDLLRQCLDSILSQTLPPTQVLVIDDGSTDATPQFLRGLKEPVQAIRVANSGKSSALNVGLRHVTGEYIWIFDDDDVAVADALERLVEPLRHDASLGFSYGHYWQTPTLADGSLGKPRAISHIPDVSTRGLLVPLLEFNFLSGAALLTRTACYSIVGDYDPQLARSQDYDMAIRIARHFRGIQVPGGPTFHQRIHAGPRGTAADRFTVNETKKKWLEYDQQIFRRLYQELPLDEYLGPGDPKRRPRTALLQRAAIMAGKRLMNEALADLTEVAYRCEQSPLSGDEVSLVRKGLAARSLYGGGIRSDRSALKALRRLSRDSRPAREICVHLRDVAFRDLATTSLGFLKSAVRADVRGARASFGRAARHMRNIAAIGLLPPSGFLESDRSRPSS